MFKSPGRIVYGVSDLEKAKEWYQQVLGKKPVFDSPLGVGFHLGSTVLSLATHESSSPQKGGTIIYWTVDDAIASYQQLCALGATPQAEPTTMAGKRSATVKDPFGNVIGIISEVSASEKTVEQKPSDTARGVAALRYLATLEEKEEIRGRDYLARVFVSDGANVNLEDKAKREWFVTKYLPPGMYYGLLARTAWFDGLVEKALGENIPQIVFLGAGYDSRPYRFASSIKDTRLFELDAPLTQERKKVMLERAGIAVPDCLTYIPIDFTRNTLKDALVTAGFQQGQNTLYVWEGVTYYLPAETIDDTLCFIREISPPGSTVCFDYYSTFPGSDEAYGVRELHEFMKTSSPGEPMQFSIDRQRIESFLLERRYALTEHLTPEDMQKRYLTYKDGTLAGRSGACTCFALARVM